MAKKGVCDQCNVVIFWCDKHVHFTDAICPKCRTPLSRYNTQESWKLPHLETMSKCVDRTLVKVSDSASGDTTRKEV